MRTIRFIASWLMAGFIISPSAAVLAYLYAHRDSSLQEIFSGPRIPLLLTFILISVLMLRGRRILLDKVDRHLLRISNSSDTVRRIEAAPGWTLRKLAEFFFSRKTYNEILEPSLRDLLDEYCEALRTHRIWKARWVRIRGYWAFWAAVLAQMTTSAGKLVSKIWKATR